MKITDAIKRLLLRDASPELLRQQAIDEGMTTLRESGLAKIDQGLTTIAEVVRSVHVSEALSA